MEKAKEASGLRSSCGRQKDLSIGLEFFEGTKAEPGARGLRLWVKYSARVTDGGREQGSEVIHESAEPEVTPLSHRPGRSSIGLAKNNLTPDGYTHRRNGQVARRRKRGGSGSDGPAFVDPSALALDGLHTFDLWLRRRNEKRPFAATPEQG
jgi:hypothetical protein